MKTQKETFSNVHHCFTAAQGRQNQRGLREGEAISGLDIGRFRMVLKDLVFLLAPFRFSNIPPSLEATFFVVTKLQRAKVNGACNTLEALFSF